MQRLYLVQKVLDPGLAEPINTERGKGIEMSSPILPLDLTKSRSPPHSVSSLVI